MKTNPYLSFITSGLFLIGTLFPAKDSCAQSNFDREAYMQFLEDNRTLSASDLINDYPPKTTYYSHRNEPVDLHSVPWFDTLDLHFNFTESETDLLRHNLFMVTERLWDYSFTDAFTRIYSRDLPLFISSDFVLSTLHNSYDAILQTLEWQLLEPNLMVLLDAMYEGYQGLYDKYSGDTRFREALFDVDLYVSMAISLLYDEAYLPLKHDQVKYDELMQGIENEALLKTELFTESRKRKLDLSQFTPRGHYNKIIYTSDGPKTLENYFKAMMWLGRIDFLLTAPPENPWEPDWTDDELRRMQLGALLLNELLYTSGKKGNLEIHEKIIEFLVGPDDNMTPDELKHLSDQVLTSPPDLFNATTFDSFMEKLNASDEYGQKIMSNYFFVDPYSEDPGKLPVSYKLLGQKFLIDSYVFSELVYDRIIVDNKKIYRGLPDPLDVMAALGNEDALALLETELDSFKYAYKMASLSYLIESYDDEFWEQSLYNTWLGAIRELNPPSSSTQLPFFMQTSAWHHEKLNTQLTSWAQLRHDNILYGKQSYTGGTGCSYPYTYIEPYPEFYETLGLFAANARDFFMDILADQDIDDKQNIIRYYTEYAEIMQKFRKISEKELSGDPLHNDEIEFLKTMINAYMASGPSITGWFTNFFFDIAKGLWWDFTVADVHTQPTDASGNEIGHVLHVGNGLINMGVFIAPSPVNPDRLMAFAGPVAAFHTEVTKGFDRLTDQEWEKRFLEEGQRPGRPDWISAFCVNREGSNYEPGRSLKGVAFNGTGTIPSEQQGLKDIDYLLAFPNPVRGDLHLRFILNADRHISVRIFDASGKMHYHYLTDTQYGPGEHDISVHTSGWSNGLYFLEFRTEAELITRKIMVH